jgi:sterol desaturase/sphingolipid hydroxylase (fatty acid hydroxylase superfamily)
MFVNFPKGPLVFLIPSLQNTEFLLDLLGIFVISDFCFYTFHRSFHYPLIYKHVHALHHRVQKPTSYSNCELFTLLDGLGHVLVYHIGLSLYYTYVAHPPGCDDIYNTVWIIGGLQWFIFGQCEHGGKNIPIRLIPGLTILRHIFGIDACSPKLHDIHHSKLTVNFSLTGIFDRFFGTLLEDV